MHIVLESLADSDGPEILDIFNYYAENSFAAYSLQPLPDEMACMFLDLSNGYPAVIARDESGTAVGFGLLRPFSPMPAFAATAEITLFLRNGYTGHGIGKVILSHLIEQATEIGLVSVLASISSLNEGSLRFHLRNGFQECGRFREAGEKLGKRFDVVYCQRMMGNG
ncbi:MAG: GNAT family N-acetyltransferase [Chlorobium sp.]|jgi:L-amino acid N-acyltransferase YncA|uniref:GNAT family N-acetyltransferase n=1 Tax=Chlorobium sp. TaxID=1095 RepID=UPI001D55CB61|nr:GNAT family N-acetyltransferase [Chlorobium sp.]MBN1279136.1 N-acetyltransferase [Chlorobiaceae bacterium]MCF8216003.1 GNAT family N-acetyltransferase [Chlorobium sp.]MCF8270512.1 GNAT family N-acetyltransferase [Chlorobium sp.]MCF8287278.1 GNAT family N-acetyltransferase [Chlorobium sp.]MCF8290480.1 GNAT family N-acetyltransferase [Chlorobium sp.]